MKDAVVTGLTHGMIGRLEKTGDLIDNPDWIALVKIIRKEAWMIDRSEPAHQILSVWREAERSKQRIKTAGFGPPFSARLLRGKILDGVAAPNKAEAEQRGAQ